MGLGLGLGSPAPLKPTPKICNQKLGSGMGEHVPIRSPPADPIYGIDLTKNVATMIIRNWTPRLKDRRNKTQKKVGSLTPRTPR